MCQYCLRHWVWQSSEYGTGETFDSGKQTERAKYLFLNQLFFRHWESGERVERLVWCFSMRVSRMWKHTPSWPVYSETKWKWCCLWRRGEGEGMVLKSWKSRYRVYWEIHRCWQTSSFEFLFCLWWVPIGALFSQKVGSLFLSLGIPITCMPWTDLTLTCFSQPMDTMDSWTGFNVLRQ